ncbi:TerD family protein [Deinococcus lacus]|uniref:TerD family protein n=1 Tax=Deinococcus lacus TaxID=392561 RepID=A0ABW1YF84_9DEIO
MQTFQTGQKSQLAQLPGYQAGQRLTLSARVTGPGDYDLILFGLDAAGKLTDDRYMIFYNQPRSPEGAIESVTGPRGERSFTVDLGRLPPSIQRLSLAATTDQGHFGQIDHAEMTLMGPGPLAGYRVTGRDFTSERAIMLFDLYFKDVWRAGAVGQGFSGGLAALVRHYGGEVADSPLSNPPQRPPAPPPSPPPPPPPPPAPPQPASSVNLNKVTLDKPGQSARLSLRKGEAVQPVRINLNWDRAGRYGRAADLDLGCMYVMNDGDMGVIQALGNHYGSDRFEPYIMLDKDDRTGEDQDGENLTIHRPELIHTVLIFAFIYEGTSDFTHVNGRLTLQNPGAAKFWCNSATRICAAPSARLP